jgi:hypothetical protein
MGLNIVADFEVPFNPNMNPEPVVRPYPGLTDGLICAYHFDYNPTPLTPVAGSAIDVEAVLGGGTNQVRRGFGFRGNDVVDKTIVPGAALAGFTIGTIARRTGFTPAGASQTGSFAGIGPVGNNGFRLDCTALRPTAGLLLNSSQTGALEGDTSVWDFYVLSVNGDGCKLYRPRIREAPVVGSGTIATIGAAQLNNPLRIGTAGTAVTWSEVEEMAPFLFGRVLSDAEVLDQYAAYQPYAADLGVEI